MAEWACALLLAVLFLHVSGANLQGSCADGTKVSCSGQDDSGVAAHLFSRSSYLQLINRSLENYSAIQECSSGCGCHMPVMNADLAVWREQGGITRENFLSAKDSRYRGVHYVIIDHVLYREPECMFQPRCKGVEHFILECINELPNMEFIVNVRDFPLSSRYRQPLPIFSFSKTKDYYDIMYPAWSFWSGGPAISTEPRGLGRWDIKRQSITKAAEQWPWQRKKSIGFFRGSRTTPERDPLVVLSRDKQDLVDAQYTKNQAWKSDKDTLGLPPADVVTLEDHCQYKYLFNFRGVAASFRLRHLFLCRSLVLHVGEDWEEFFYHSLKPWVHYVPIKQDLSNAREVLQFLIDNDNDRVAMEIAERGFAHIMDHLDMDDVLCYWKTLLQNYANLTKWTVEKLADSSFLKISA